MNPGWINLLAHMKAPVAQEYSEDVVVLILREFGTEMVVLSQVKPRLMAEGVGSIVDRKLHDYPQDVYKDMTDLAITCAAFHKDVRPTMKVSSRINAQGFHIVSSL